LLVITPTLQQSKTPFGKANARRTLKGDWPVREDFCSESNPSPGSKISTPEFGYELFAARLCCRAAGGNVQTKIIHISQMI
jgi:hypothetical protein